MKENLQDFWLRVKVMIKFMVWDSKCDLANVELDQGVCDQSVNGP